MSDVANEIMKSLETDGFLYQARHLVFDELAATLLIASIEKITPESDPHARDAILKAIWQMPFLALLWEERCVREGADVRKYRKVVRDLRDVVARKIETLLPTV